MRGSADELKESAAERAKKNQRLRDRLENMKGQVSKDINAMLGGMMNLNPEDVMSEEEINAHLKEACNTEFKKKSFHFLM